MNTIENQTVRRYDLDWLRVAGVLAVFIFHSFHFFDLGDWSVKNGITYGWISALMDFMAVWVMPLIFLVSGASVYYAVNKSNAAKFIRDKIMRLFVPLLVGVFTFSIMQVYLERVSHGQFQGSFLDFVPHYFEGVYFPGSTGNFAFHGMHLWYLLFLFVFTLAFMPLFWWFKGKYGSRLLYELGDLLAKQWAPLLLLLPTVIIQNLTDKGDHIVNGGWRIVHYPWFFLAGYLIVSREKLQLRIIKMRWIFAGLAIALLALSIIQHRGLNNHQDILVWLELLAVLGFAMKRLNFSNKFLVYANEAVMPFYILHQNILLLLGFFVVGWAVHDIAKFLIIVISTLMAIMVLYEYLIRRYNWLRILFGMKMIKN
jgi:glucans biosynthesis protein C